MQPPTKPPPAGDATPARERPDPAELYRRHHRDLLRAVTRAVNAPTEVIEDACQTAWTILLRSEVRPATAFAWLRVVAIHEAFHQSARARTEKPAGGFQSAAAAELVGGEHAEPPADTRDVADQVAARIQHAQRLQDLAAIKPADRLALYLKGLGFSYHEIMAATGASYTAVNRRITEGRRALRKLEHAREQADNTEQADSHRDAPPPP
jgi:DNA-directed RNA polymerase specialized sigma24 family protein